MRKIMDGTLNAVNNFKLSLINMPEVDGVYILVILEKLPSLAVGVEKELG